MPYRREQKKTKEISDTEISNYFPNFLGTLPATLWWRSLFLLSFLFLSVFTKEVKIHIHIHTNQKYIILDHVWLYTVHLNVSQFDMAVRCNITIFLICIQIYIFNIFVRIYVCVCFDMCMHIIALETYGFLIAVTVSQFFSPIFSTPIPRMEIYF